MKRILVKDKYDRDIIDNLTEEQLQVHVAELWTWMQDINWPVAEPIAKLLAKNSDVATPGLIEILESQDVIWKHNALTHVAAGFSTEKLRSLENVIAEQITVHEQQAQDEDISAFLDIAKELLYRCKLEK